MPEYHGRYTCSGDLQQQIVDFISRNAQKYIIAQEHASREHIQCYIEYENTKKTWDNKFKIKFPELDRRDKYFKEDKGNTKVYVCKEKVILAKRGFSDDDIENFHTIYHQQNPKHQISLKIEESPILLPEIVERKVKKPRPPTFMRQCRDELEELYPTLDWKLKHKRIVFLKVMRNLGQGCKNLDHIIITRMTYGVLNSLIKDTKEWDEYWYHKCFGEELNPPDSDFLENELEDDFLKYLQEIQQQKDKAEQDSFFLPKIGKK